MIKVIIGLLMVLGALWTGAWILGDPDDWHRFPAYVTCCTVGMFGIGLIIKEMTEYGL